MRNVASPTRQPPIMAVKKASGTNGVPHISEISVRRLLVSWDLISPPSFWTCGSEIAERSPTTSMMSAAKSGRRMLISVRKGNPTINPMEISDTSARIVDIFSLYSCFRHFSVNRSRKYDDPVQEVSASVPRLLRMDQRTNP